MVIAVLVQPDLQCTKAAGLAAMGIQHGHQQLVAAKVLHIAVGLVLLDNFLEAPARQVLQKLLETA